MRKHNFYPGPAALPESVLLKAQAELLDWRGHGMSIVEVSHRAPIYMDFVAEIEAKLRRILKVPDNYKIIFVASPARGQYAAIPMNLLGDHASADYFETGYWSMLAYHEAMKYCKPNLVCSGKQDGYRTIPDPSTWQLNPNAAYCHYITNETIHGVQFHQIPDVGDVPLAADMTSDFLAYPLDVSRFGLIFAGTQKNVAPSGMTIVIVRDDLLDRELPITPSCWSYKKQSEAHSLLYTSVSFSCYIAGLMFDWVDEQGGLAMIEKNNRRRAALVYSAVDESELYINKVDPQCRSMINIPVQIADENLTERFLQEAEEWNLIGLRGHRVQGGIRVNLYNAQTDEAVFTLVDFMRDFAKRYG